MLDARGGNCRRLLVRLLTGACAAAALVAAAAPVPAPGEAGSASAPTVTRLVRAFGDLEDQLNVAAREHDTGALDRLLGADFELRNAARPGVPVPRAEFVQQLLAKPLPVEQVEQMAVHDLGSAAIASFVLQSADGAPALFVVDVWVETDTHWQLQIRYVGPGGTQAAQSGAPMPDSSQNLPKKY